MTTAAVIPRLRWRPTLADDLPECLRLFPAWVGVEAGADLLALWRRLLDEPSVMSTLMEDLAQPAGQRIRGWGCGVVLPPPWAQLHGLAPPALRPRRPVVAQLYADLLAGRVQLLDDRALGEVNARGHLQFLNLHYTQQPSDLADDYALAILNVANDAFRSAASGWWLQAMHFESSARDAPMFESAGFPRLPYVDASALAGLPDERRPVYLGITREAARGSLPGTSVRHAFEHCPPRFRWSASQRRLLWQALYDDSDEALMRRLQVSVHGLKKLWRGIYERIEDVQPDFFGDDAGADDGRRGPEKRRQVLGYVRQRPEELRPGLPA
jgi:hypothetical protein